MSGPELYKYFPSFHWVQRNLFFLWLTAWSKAKYITIFANVILILFSDKLKSLCSTEVGFYKEKIDGFSCSEMGEQWEWNTNSSTLSSMNGIVGPSAFKYEPRKHVLHILRNPGHASVHPKLISLNLYVVHFFFLNFWPYAQHVGCYSTTKNGTCRPCIGRQSLNHWTQGKSLCCSFLLETFIPFEVNISQIVFFVSLDQ